MGVEREEMEGSQCDWELLAMSVIKRHTPGQTLIEIVFVITFTNKNTFKTILTLGSMVV